MIYDSTACIALLLGVVEASGGSKEGEQRDDLMVKSPGHSTDVEASFYDLRSRFRSILAILVYIYIAAMEIT